MKALVSILFSLALVLSHLPGFAGSVRQLCQSETPCGCGDSACCVSEAGSESAPLNPVPTSDHSRTQLLAACQTVLQLAFARPTTTPPLPAPAAIPALAAVPLYVRNCSFLI